MLVECEGEEDDADFFNVRVRIAPGQSIQSYGIHSEQAGEGSIRAVRAQAMEKEVLVHIFLRTCSQNYAYAHAHTHAHHARISSDHKLRSVPCVFVHFAVRSPERNALCAHALLARILEGVRKQAGGKELLRKLLLTHSVDHECTWEFRFTRAHVLSEIMIT